MGKKFYIVTADESDIRSGPGRNFEVWESVEKDFPVETPDLDNWVPITLEDDSVGWVLKEHLREARDEEIEAEEEPVKPQGISGMVSGVSFPFHESDLPNLFGVPNHGEFMRRNITTIDLSEFAGHFDHVDGVPFTSFDGHRILERPLKKALQLVIERGLAGELTSFAGCFAIRQKKGGRGYSVHSWGLAVDFNADENPFQKPPPEFEDMERDLSDDFVRCFAEAGFEWGGLWDSVKDPMHFQLAWNYDWEEMDNPLGPKVFQEEAAGPSPAPHPGTFTTPEQPLAWGKKVSAEFRQRVREIAAALQTDPNYLMACMAFETGETFSPSVLNQAGSGAVGLIQFMPSTAQGLGTTSDALASMTAEKQLDFVEKYFKWTRGRLSSLDDVYMAILWPNAVGKPSNYVLFDRRDPNHPRRYIQNAGLDFNEDGKVTKAEAAGRVRKALERGKLPQFASA